METNISNRRARNWCAIVYPDSAPENWKSLLDSKHLKWACSPIHDKDKEDDSEEGKLKKAHWHIVICYSGNKSFEQVSSDISCLNGPIPQICHDVTAAVRYFTHKDHPHKYQYSIDDILCFGGFECSEAFKLSRSEITRISLEIADFIEKEDIIEFFDLDCVCRHEHIEDSWYEVLRTNTIYFDRLIKSNRHRDKSYNRETGEIYGENN